MHVSPELTIGVLVMWGILVITMVWRMSALVSNLGQISEDLHELTAQFVRHMDSTRIQVQDLDKRVGILEATRQWGPH